MINRTHTVYSVLFVWHSQQVSGGDGPGSDQAFEPLACVTLFQQRRQNHLQQQQL